ncbi:MAG: dephospho-CoA kinase [Gemmataceae bacterium]
MVKPFVVGLTGSIGAGKSTVGRLFGLRGAEVIDADALGHAALTELREPIVAEFGPAILDQRGQISRTKLGAIVFADPQKRQALEAIVHPHIRRQAEEQIRQSGAALVVVDAALLIEAGWQHECDRVVYVDAPWELRLQRVQARSGWDAATLRAREAAQLPLTSKRAHANHIVMNDSSLEALQAQVDHLLRLWGFQTIPPPSPSERS